MPLPHTEPVAPVASVVPAVLVASAPLAGAKAPPPVPAPTPVRRWLPVTPPAAPRDTAASPRGISTFGVHGTCGVRGARCACGISATCQAERIQGTASEPATEPQGMGAGGVRGICGVRGATDGASQCAGGSLQPRGGGVKMSVYTTQVGLN